MKKFALLLGLLLTTPALADDHVVILLDTSGSMAEGMHRVRVTKMKAAQDALCDLVQKMPSTTQLGLITFNGWQFHLEPIDETKAQVKIRETYPTGGTPLGAYMKQGADELLTTREKNHGVGTYTLLVVTDGEASDENLMNANTDDITSRGLTLKTIGVNLPGEHTLAKKSVAYFAADDPQSLQKALEKATAEVPAGNDDIAEDAYAMMAGIPNDMAPQLIQAITNTITLNQPIGEKPKVKVVDAQGNVSYVASPPDADSGGGWSIGAVVLTIVVAVFCVLVFAAILGSGSRY